MSADFWAGYASGAAGILIGNPLDLWKVRLQAGSDGNALESITPRQNYTSLIKGAAAPILGYGALNALLFVSYNRTLMLLDTSLKDPTSPFTTSLFKIWSAGVVGGFATWIVSAPTELVKCRTQLSVNGQSSWRTTQDIWQRTGIRGLYFGGGVTSLRDAVGYGFYFWSYELSKRYMTTYPESGNQAALKVLLCGGLAGVVTWASIFPLDVIKTRMQTQLIPERSAEQHSLLAVSQPSARSSGAQKGAIQIAKQAYQEGGINVFFRGLGVCSVRAFVVNAAQWTIYEWIMRNLRPA